MGSIAVGMRSARVRAFNLRRWFLFGLVVTLLAASFIFRSSVSAAVTPLILPNGFADETAIGGLLAPRAFAFAPDGRVLIVERGSASSTDINFGSVRVFKNGALLPTRALTINI